ncbi:MAG TPA: DNA repair protein RecN [Chitinophagaceae bacterium]|jgi:DNA repair protein RecN (Recombination protein N)|nr:DNA repair protein RecN [Chitinophagaceae bacterium]
MLQKLSIQNYAIIEELEIDFSGKLNVITGETGAGKSIIVGALGLILGERADSAALVDKSKKCIVEGVFDAGAKKAIRQFLADNDFDNNEELVVRREIGTNGKSRAFVNDTPVTLSQLNELSRLLVDLHQQFDTLEIGESDFQRDVLDALAGHGTVVDEYRVIYRQWQLLAKEAEVLKTRKQQLDKEADYNRFQFTELEEAGFKENELEDIDAELKLLNNSEGIKAALNKVYFELKESEEPVVQQLKILLNQLNTYAAYHPDLPALLQRMQSAQIELQDIADSIDHISAHVNYDPARIEQLNERLSLGYKLQKKHGVNTTHELLLIREQLEEKLQAVINMDDTIRQKEKELEKIQGQATALAATISKGRVKQVKPLEEKVNKLLAQVGMPNAKLKADIQHTDLNSSGTDAIEFLFDANKSGKFQPVRKVASGGELSRLMLCIKSLVAQSIDLPTLIFDEIDTGVSGEAARQVGLIMKELAANRQVICITHQPQIAGKATAHFFVYKEIVNDAVKTNIRQLSTEERITAIAKMLSGEKPTAAAMENAREMVMN